MRPIKRGEDGLTILDVLMARGKFEELQVQLKPENQNLYTPGPNRNHTLLHYAYYAGHLLEGFLCLQSADLLDLSIYPKLIALQFVMQDFNKAKEIHQRGQKEKYNEAVTLIERALSWYKESRLSEDFPAYEFYAELGLILFEQAKLEKALDVFEQASSHVKKTVGEEGEKFYLLFCLYSQMTRCYLEQKKLNPQNINDDILNMHDLTQLVGSFFKNANDEQNQIWIKQWRLIVDMHVIDANYEGAIKAVNEMVSVCDRFVDLKRYHLNMAEAHSLLNALYNEIGNTQSAQSAYDAAYSHVNYIPFLPVEQREGYCLALKNRPMIMKNSRGISTLMTPLEFIQYPIQLGLMAKSWGFQCESIPGESSSENGNSFFHIFLRQIKTKISGFEQVDHAVLRIQLMQHLDAYRDAYAVSEEFLALQEADINQYIETLSVDQVHADEFIVFAASNAWNVNIVVIHDSQPVQICKPTQNPRATLYIGSHHLIHFQNLLPHPGPSAQLQALIDDAPPRNFIRENTRHSSIFKAFIDIAEKDESFTPEEELAAELLNLKFGNKN